VGNKTFTKESGWTNALGSVDDLIRKDKVTRRNLFSERTNSRESQDSLYTKVLQGSDVGTAGNFRGCEIVTTAMTSQKGDLEPRRRAGNDDLIAWETPWLYREVEQLARGREVLVSNPNPNTRLVTYSFWVNFLNNFEVVEIIETGAANDGNGNFVCVDHFEQERGEYQATWSRKKKKNKKKL
jgi:hypothetical protein